MELGTTDSSLSSSPDKWLSPVSEQQPSNHQKPLLSLTLHQAGFNLLWHFNVQPAMQSQQPYCS